MILERLKEFAQRVELPREGYDLIPISYTINLDKNGRFLGFIPLFEDETKEKATKPKLGKRIQLPFIEKTSGVKANLLSGNSEYVLCVPRKKELKKYADKGNAEDYIKKVKERFEAFLKEIDACAVATESPEVIAVQRFLKDSLEAARAELPKDLNDTENFTFKVEGEYVANVEAVAQYWGEKQCVGQEDEDSDDSSDEDDTYATIVPTTCMLCGSDGVIPAIHPKLKPVPGGQPSGVALISSNKQPFNSYGLTRAHIAPLCRSCSEPIHKSIKWLIRSDTNKFSVGKAILLFWTREPVEFHIAVLLNEPTEENVKELLKAPFKGKAANVEFEANKFYMLALSGSGGRAVVRDWIETALNDVQSCLRNYFIGHHIHGGREPYQKLMGLAGATVRDLDQPAPWVPLSLAEHALRGSPLPSSLLSTAVRRCAIGKINMRTRKREHVSAQQAALVKLCLRSMNQQNGKEIREDWMVKLDLQCEKPAYLYGRLFNVLEQIQRVAIFGTGKDADQKEVGVERTFGAAMMFPMSILPRLEQRAKQAHLTKLRRDDYAIYKKLSGYMEEIHSKLNPQAVSKAQLKAEEQGLFVLGYWHQSGRKWDDIREAQERKSTETTNPNQTEN